MLLVSLGRFVVFMHVLEQKNQIDFMVPKGEIFTLKERTEQNLFLSWNEAV